ncbi:MAG: LytTR family DNA-binding domain-containing protein [Woeseiaceae bacterium]|nr:LytTR family DNA-binding domain-containing protein [Woeseiaceae bacterium]
MRVLIVDDEAPARERLMQLVGDIDGYEVAGEAGNGNEAVEFTARDRPDIVLLDIRMPGLDGIETAHHLNQVEDPPAIVFTTAYDEYAIDAFEARAIGYVLKPVRRSRLEAALKQASRLARSTLAEVASTPGVQSQRQHVCARAADRLTLIPIEDINYFRADQKYVAVHHKGGESLIDESLKSLEQEFEQFVRIHRSALVAVDKIERLEKTSDGKQRVVIRECSQDEDDALIISRRHVAEVRRRLKGG